MRNPAAAGFPNGSGTIPPENGMVSEILGERGWNTYIVGKWHLCPTDEMNLASTRRNWARGPGVRAVLRVPRRRDQPVVPVGLPVRGREAPVQRDRKVGEGRIKNQPGYFELAGEGLCVGRDSGAAVTDDYSGERPCRLPGG